MKIGTKSLILASVCCVTGVEYFKNIVTNGMEV